MIVIWRACGALVAIGGLAAVVWASSAPLTVHDEPHGLLRLAWSARPERIETCVEQSDEALARLPQHMRQPVLCEGVTAHYRLIVHAGGRLIAERIVRGGGLRQDRRLYVFDELPLEAGDVLLDVLFERLDSGRSSPVSTSVPEEHGAAAPPAGARHQPVGDAVPPRLRFHERVHVRPREVLLITYSPELKTLTAIRHDRADRR